MPYLHVQCTPLHAAVLHTAINTFSPYSQLLVSQLLDVVGIAGRRYRLGGAPAALTPRARSGSLLCQSARDADRPCAGRKTGTGIEDYLDVLIGGFRPSLRSTTLGVSVSLKPHDRIDSSRR